MPNVSVSYQEMEAAGARLSAGRTEIDASLSALANQVEALVSSGFVTDASSGAFLQSYQAFTIGCRQTVEGLDGMAHYLRTAAATFRDTDQQLAGALRR